MTTREMGRVAVWSADYTGTTGQALVTRRVVEHVLSGSNYLSHVYKAGLKEVGSWIVAVLGLWLDIIAGRVATIYLVCSRSNAGFFRDLPALLGARLGLRVIVHVHGADIIDLLARRAISPLARAMYSRCELVVPSPHLVDALRDIGSKDVHLCENFATHVDPQTSTDLRPEDSSALVVVWNSNVMASKGFFDVAEAVQRARVKGDDVSMVSFGRPLRDQEMGVAEVKRRLGGLLGYDWLSYFGPVDQSVVDASTTRAGVVCLPSRYSSECQPLAIAQAMCAGVEVVVADTPALRASIGDYPASFVPPHDVSAIEEALRRLALSKRSGQSRDLSLASSAARERFSPTRFDRDMREIIFGRMA
jgi:glycosyltransferase involved in cell wall biosynthesis